MRREKTDKYSALNFLNFTSIDEFKETERSFHKDVSFYRESESYRQELESSENDKFYKVIRFLNLVSNNPNAKKPEYLDLVSKDIKQYLSDNHHLFRLKSKLSGKTLYDYFVETQNEFFISIFQECCPSNLLSRNQKKNTLDQNAKILKTIITKQHIDSISQISLLLDKYPELVNYKLDHQTGKTPLHFAALNYKNTITNFLLEKGADANSLDKSNYPPIYYAIEKGYFNQVQSLIKHTSKNFLFKGQRTFVDILLMNLKEDEVLQHRYDNKKNILNLLLDYGFKISLYRGFDYQNPDHFEINKDEFDIFFIEQQPLKTYEPFRFNDELKYNINEIESRKSDKVSQENYIFFKIGLTVNNKVIIIPKNEVSISSSLFQFLDKNTADKLFNCKNKYNLFQLTLPQKTQLTKYTNGSDALTSTDLYGNDYYRNRLGIDQEYSSSSSTYNDYTPKKSPPISRPISPITVNNPDDNNYFFSTKTILDDHEISFEEKDYELAEPNSSNQIKPQNINSKTCDLNKSSVPEEYDESKHSLRNNDDLSFFCGLSPIQAEKTSDSNGKIEDLNLTMTDETGVSQNNQHNLYNESTKLTLCELAEMSESNETESHKSYSSEHSYKSLDLNAEEVNINKFLKSDHQL